MKTITEFDGFKIKNALATRREKIRALRDAGKQPAEIDVELPAALGEAFKLEGDKLKLMITVINHAESTGLEKDGGALKRIIVLELAETEKPPAGAQKPVARRAKPQRPAVQPKVEVKPVEAATDPAPEPTPAVSESPEASPSADVAASEAAQAEPASAPVEEPAAAESAPPAEAAPVEATPPAEEPPSPYWFLSEYFPGVPKRGRPGRDFGRDDRRGGRGGGRDGKGKKGRGGRGGDRGRGPGRDSGRDGERAAGGRGDRPPRDPNAPRGPRPPRDPNAPRGEFRGPRPPRGDRPPRGPRPENMPTDIPITVVGPDGTPMPANSAAANPAAAGDAARRRRRRRGPRPEIKREPIRPGTGIPAVKPLERPIASAPPAEAKPAATGSSSTESSS